MSNFERGYKNDAGIDIILNKDITFYAGRIQILDLEVKYTPQPNTFAYLVARTSAAKNGLFVQSCPIDADYTGTINAIVFNASTENIKYKAGSSFCQLVIVPLVRDPHLEESVCIKKEGRRTDGAFGSTDRR